MQFPDRLHQCAAARWMGFVLKSEASDIDRQRRINLAQVLVRPDSEVMRGKLRLKALSRLAVFRVARYFHNGPGRILVRDVRYFQVNIAVA